MRILYLHTVDVVMDPWHPVAQSGDSVLRIVGTNQIIDLAYLREDPNRKIVTDDPEAVCRVLGIQYPDMQVVEERA